VFELAWGQGLNHGKSSLLPIAPPHPEISTATLVAGTRVRHSAAALCFSFAAGLAPPSHADGWESLVRKVDSKITTLSRLPPSVFGRAMGASSYAVFNLLYHAESLDSLSDSHIADMPCDVVARGQADLNTAWVRKLSSILSGRGFSGLGSTYAVQSV
jgi:hypothetical protein